MVAQQAQEDTEPKGVSMKKKYCQCPIYLTSGEDACLFCGLPAKPIIQDKRWKR